MHSLEPTTVGRTAEQEPRSSWDPSNWTDTRDVVQDEIAAETMDTNAVNTDARP